MKTRKLMARGAGTLGGLTLATVFGAAVLAALFALPLIAYLVLSHLSF